MCVYVLQVLLELTCDCVIGWVCFQGLRVAIHLVTDGGHVGSTPRDLPGDLHRCCLFAFFVDECNCCFGQVCRCHFWSLFCVASRCIFLPALLCNVFLSVCLDIFTFAPAGVSFTYVWYFQFVSYRSLSGCVTFADSYLTANIESWNKACTLGIYYS